MMVAMKKVIIKKVRNSEGKKPAVFAEELKRLMRWKVKVPMQVYTT